MRIVIVFALFFFCISCQDVPSCESDDCYNKYHEQIEHYKDMVSKLFVQLDEIIDNMKDLNVSLADLNEELKIFPNASWSIDIKAADESAKKTADSDFVTENDIKNIEKQLKNWIEFLENLKKLNNDVMNIPYSISSEIDLIDTLLSDENDENCLQKFHDELKKLFATIATLLNFDDFLPKLKVILTELENNRKEAEQIMDETNTILAKEELVKKTVQLANKTLDKANKLEELKKQISNLQNKEEEEIQSNVNEALRKFDEDFNKLLKNYRTSKYEELLDNLKTTTEELEELSGGKPVDTKLIIEDINKFSECSDCYTEFLTKCRQNIQTSDNCLKKIEECQNIV